MKHRAIALAPAILLVAGCAAQGAPSVPFFGAYFPAWLLAAILGVMAAIIARIVLGVTGLDEVVPWLLAVCSSIGLIVAIAVSALVFG